MTRCERRAGLWWRRGAACGPEVWCGMWEGRDAQAEGGDENWAASWLAEGEEGIRIELGIEG